jgi:hypothetical protein
MFRSRWDSQNAAEGDIPRTHPVGGRSGPALTATMQRKRTFRNSQKWGIGKTYDIHQNFSESNYQVIAIQSTSIKRYLQWSFVRLVLGISLATSINAATTFPPGRWVEEARLHDGRTIGVEREVFETGRELCFLCLAERRYSSFNRHSLRFLSPDTQSSIEWAGEDGFIPVLLDFVGGVPFLVVQGRPTQESAKRYGCPELPFIYLKYESGYWRPIPVDDAPSILRNANLVSDVREISGGNLTHQQVLKNIANYKQRSGGYFQTQIPRTYAEWDYSGKDGARNDRGNGDCRPPPAGPKEVVLPKPTDIELQLIESTDVDNRIRAEELLRWQPNPQSQRNCQEVFRVADLNNRMAGRRFTKDPTGSKPVPYVGPAPVRYADGSAPFVRAFEYCDADFVWFVAEREDVGKIFVTKYTVQGELVYNVRFNQPQTVTNQSGGRILVDLVKSEGGYFMFYWVSVLPARSNEVKSYPGRITKFRFIELQMNQVLN